MSHGLQSSGLLSPRGLRSATVLIAIAALVFAGCGGSSASPTAKASAKAKANLIARADAICKGLNARRKTANAQVGAVRSARALPRVARVAPGLAAYEHNALLELRRLTAPAALAENWQRILAGIQALADNTAKLGVDAGGGNLRAVEAVIHVDQQKERELITVATTAGFQHCGRNA